MSSKKKITHHSYAHEIAEAVRSGAATATEVIELFISRIETLNPKVNAICFTDFDGARARAKEIDEILSSPPENKKKRAEAGKLKKLPLLGVPMTVKEEINVKNFPVSRGLAEFKNYIAPEDSVPVSRLRAAGVVFLGKSNVPMRCIDYQTHSSLFAKTTGNGGTTRNPFDQDLSAGGSSGGAGVAVACRLVPIELAADSAGSTRVPANFSGVIGHQPRHGFLPIRHWSSTNLLPPESRPAKVENELSSSSPSPHHLVSEHPLRTNGPMCRCVEDVHLMLEVLAGPDSIDPTFVSHHQTSHEEEEKEEEEEDETEEEKQANQIMTILRPSHVMKKALKDFRVAVFADDSIAPVTKSISAAVSNFIQVISPLVKKLSTKARPQLPNDVNVVEKNYKSFSEWSFLVYQATYTPELQEGQFGGVSQHAHQRALTQWCWQKFFSNNSEEGFDVAVMPVFFCPSFEAIRDHEDEFNAIFDDKMVIPECEKQEKECEYRYNYHTYFWPHFSQVARIAGTAFPTGFTKSNKNKKDIPVGLQVVSNCDHQAVHFAGLVMEALLEKERGHEEFLPDIVK